ncbi:bifunctional metallophosphatase/5'-nucleotidase [Streptomyces sp. NPDC090303]|uniref:bifunctional metallophosphatase/5'-nucleotidase n=1 Tax=Streptomyces sp. NPDC090303 TaxID=3365960 RepID=UPI0038106698
MREITLPVVSFAAALRSTLGRSRGVLTSRRRPAALGCLVTTAALLLLPASTGAARADAPPTSPGTPVQLLALNDLHGNLLPVPGAAGRITHRGPDIQAGGIAQMATLMDEARKGEANSLTVAAGDMIGGSPLLSAVFHDEPTVDALQQLGLGVTSVGNHEFDEGAQELKRMVNGGCHPTDGCVPGAPYKGAEFGYLAANVTLRGSTTPLLKPYEVKTLPNGQRIGFIGLVTKDAPSAINASMIRDVEFHDELPVIEKYSQELTRQGVRAQVLLIHEGEVIAGQAGGACDEDGPGSRLVGRIKDIALKASPEVDLIVSGHSHASYECTVPDPEGKRRLVTQADSFGRSFTDLRFTLDGTGQVLRDTVTAQYRPVPVTTTPQPAMAKLVETWRARSQDMANRVVGYISEDLPGRGSTAAEKPLGSFIADAQAAAGRPDGADLALMNPGSMRADLVHRDGNAVTYADAYQVQPFESPLWVLPLTGVELVTALQEQFTGDNEASPRFLQLSKELSYSVNMGREGADRLLVDSIRIKGQPVDLAATYHVVVNEFLANGGNGFTVFGRITDRQGGEITDLDALVSYLTATTSAVAPAGPPAPGRISFVTD